MIVSWNWLQDYLPLEQLTPEEVAHQLAMAGLNHEGTAHVGDDLAIDLEVTSNRPDCLGHVGVAREIGVQWGLPLRCENPQPPTTAVSAASVVRVRIDCPQLCARYTARIVRGVTIKPSPRWLQRRLETLGMASINNVVDISNYVMMENGQPLHAFDLAQLQGSEIIVRDARADEQFVAIDHRTYTLRPGMCVIADRHRSVALGGVMGGADSEVSATTCDLLIEAADFSPLSIRNTARALNLHSPSSYRFERGVDPAGIDWASRRCCELILELAGGEMAEGVVDVRAVPPAEPPPIVLRRSQLPRVLGIDIAWDEVRRILTALGCAEQTSHDSQLVTVPPSWRRDLSREIDLIEEIARIHGYDEIPENVGVAMVPSHQRDSDRVLDTIRHIMTAAGFDEAVTASAVSDSWCAAITPWTNTPALHTQTPMLHGADRLRRSLLPSLLGARKFNESRANPIIELFETAHVYLPQPAGLPEEPPMLALTSGRGFDAVKGVLQTLVTALNPSAELDTVDCHEACLDEAWRCELRVDDTQLGLLGKLAGDTQRQFGLRSETTVAELRMDVLEKVACLVPIYRPVSQFPAIDRDVNLILDESVRWADLARTIRQAAGSHLDALNFCEVYRDENRDGPGKKRLLFTFKLRSFEGTLSNEEADVVRDHVIAACARAHQAQVVT